VSRREVYTRAGDGPSCFGRRRRIRSCATAGVHLHLGGGVRTAAGGSGAMLQGRRRSYTAAGRDARATRRGPSGLRKRHHHAKSRARHSLAAAAASAAAAEGASVWAPACAIVLAVVVDRRQRRGADIVRNTLL